MMEDMESSFFPGKQPTYPDAELLQIGGATCQCYKVKLYGKLHFLKQLKPELQSDPRYVAALRKEFETGYLLDHPLLVRYLSRTDDSILMDYVDGETLNQFIAHHPDYFKEKKNVDRFVSQLLDVVGYLHQHQIIHLDLKPANILITRIGHDVKLADLGFCYTDTYTDTMGYTEGYAAPELLNGSTRPDARTDIYAIGKILQQIPCTNKYQKIIRRATAYDPNRRFSSVEEMVLEMEPRHRNLWPWMLALSIVVLSLSAFFLFQQKESKPPHDTTTPQETAQVEASVDSNDDSIALPIEEQHIAEQKKEAVAEPPSVRVEASPVVAPEKKEPTTPKVTTVDLSTLRKELHDLCRPVFEEQLGAYRDSSYQSMGFIRFNRLTTNFKQSMNPLFDRLWEQRYKTSGISERDFSTECVNTCHSFINNLYDEMKRND